MSDSQEAHGVIAIGGDHAGWPMKQLIQSWLSERGVTVLDVGTNGPESVDYPDFAVAVGTAIQEGRAQRGILVCGSGAGICIAANKMQGIRAAVCHDTYSAHQCVEHDNVNILCLGGRIIGEELAREIVITWLDARFSNDERHVRRCTKVHDIEHAEIAGVHSA